MFVTTFNVEALGNATFAAYPVTVPGCATYVFDGSRTVQVLLQNNPPKYASAAFQ